MIWKPVEGFPYEVSSEGQVRRISTKRLRKLEVANNGYLRVDLRNNKKRWKASVHVLVLEAFVGPRPEGMEAAHLDGNKANNCYTNLAWKTHSDNLRDRERHGTLPVGQSHHAALLTDEQYEDIINSNETHQEAANRYGIKRSTVAGIRHRAKQKTTNN